MTASAFQSASRYPELLTVLKHFSQIHSDALAANEKQIAVNDSRIQSTAWQVLPLLVEPEDKTVMSDTLCQKNRRHTAATCAMLDAIPTIKAYAFSTLQPGGHILPHHHDNPFVTAMLCLQDGGDAFIRVNTEQKYFAQGEVIIFDYTQIHEVKNNGHEDRIVLLMLLENRQHSPL